MNPSLLSVLFAITAAFFYALSNCFARAAIRSGNTAAGLLISLTVNVSSLWILALFLVEIEFDIVGWRYFFLAGLLAPILGRFFLYSGIQKIGINISAPVTYSYPLVSVAFAIWFLGERLSLAGFLGMFLTVSGIVILGFSRGSGAKKLEMKYFILPVLAAFCFGISLVLRKLGIDLIPSPILAAAVTTASSWTVFMVYVGVTRTYSNIRANPSEILYFSLAGLASSIAIPLVYLAFQIGTVVVVTPLTNLSPLFILCISHIFFRQKEVFSPHVVFGTVSVVIGVVLLSTFR